jgi:uncharacterized phage protein (TIGR01671 family)
MKEQRVIKFRAFVEDTMYEDVYFTKSNNRLIDLYQYVHGGTYLACTCDKDNLFLMQFTGLFDKAGNEIYESDIIRGKGPETVEGFYIVEYESTHWWADSGKSDLDVHYLSEITNIDVIGNLHQHKHLLT